MELNKRNNDLASEALKIKKNKLEKWVENHIEFSKFSLSQKRDD